MENNQQPSTNKILEKLNSPKKFRFHSSVRVTLIPCRQEYKDAELTDLLWYKKTDLSAMRNEMLEEKKIHQYMQETDRTISIAEAREELSQLTLS